MTTLVYRKFDLAKVGDKWHWPTADGMSLCGRAVLPYPGDRSGREPATVRSDYRCKLPGCKQAWQQITEPQENR